MSFRNRLLSTTVLPIVIGVGVGFAVVDSAPRAGVDTPLTLAAACNPCNPCAAANPCNPCNPCAVKKIVNPCAAANPCNPCNPCAAANPCNPCAAANPCNPCAASVATASECFVPRLVAAANPCNPCAAANPCNPCNPCAVKKIVNPCAAANPCNPCNPCAANPCNPCAAANPCNPCAANPCNPCAAAAATELTDAEAADVYGCIKGTLKIGYAKSNLMSDAGLKIAADYQGWLRFSTRAYVSETHGRRYVQNYANATGRDYGKYDDVGKMPAGSVLAKDSFVVRDGKVSAGPLFVMEKMASGFNADSGNWRYSLVMPDGKIIGTTNGKGTRNVEFCYGCHATVEETDSMFFMPDEYRVTF